jgi:flagellar biosynthesis GTPase FlhF
MAPGQGAPSQVGSRPTAARVSSNAELEQQLTPLRGLAHDLVTRGMPSALAGEQLAEIVAEYGNQVLVSEYDARLALLEQLLQRITGAPLLLPGEPLLGTYVIAGPSGSGKSTLIAHLAFTAVQQGQSDIVLVNTESERIGAAAQMDALGKVFGCEVAHAYTAQELRDMHAQCGPHTLLLVEVAGGALMTAEARLRNAWTWRLPFSRYVVCVPATGQCEDIQEVLAGARQITSDPAAVLAKVSETRNALPVLGALASARQPVAMVVPGPNLADPSPPPELAAVARAALGAVKRPGK